MTTVTLEEAKTKLLELVEEAAHGKPFTISEPGGPNFEVNVIERPQISVKRQLGFLKGQFKVPDDIKTPFEKEINAMFYGEE